MVRPALDRSGGSLNVVKAAILTGMYEALLSRLGPSHWWPGETPFEIAVGAILTQNTNWKNVEQAIANLRKANAMTPAGLRALPPAQLEEHIRPSGHFRIKAARLIQFLEFLEQESCTEIEELGRQNPYDLREKLLAVRGIGPETADCILLYSLGKPSFVVDAYTVRMLGRHGLIPEQTHYHEVQDIFHAALPEDAQVYNEYHALIVRAAKQWCSKSKPKCADCPLRSFLPDPDAVVA